MCLSVGRKEKDYKFFVDRLKEFLDAKDYQCFEAWVSDGEKALVQAFQQCTLFQEPSVHVLCGNHLADNIRRAFQDFGLSEKSVDKMLTNIFGFEPEVEGGRERVPGLVDVESEDQFYNALEKVSEEWKRIEYTDTGKQNRCVDWLIQHKADDLGATRSYERLLLNFISC